MANEKRLIAANDVYALFDINGFARLHVGDIDTIPRVDAVEVVRCEECQSWDTKHCADGQGWCPKVCGYRHGGWFCAAGKRKTITDQTMKALEAMDKNAHGGADDGKEE